MIAEIRASDVDQVTASIGVAVLPDDASDAVTLFRSADRALYSAKSNGRNRVETIGSEPNRNPSHAAPAPVAADRS